MPEVLNLISAGELPIILAAKHSFDIEMEFLEDDETTPLPLAPFGTFKMCVSRINQPATILKTYTVGSGLAITGSELNFLVISRTVLLNTLKPGTYQYDIRSDVSGTGKSYYHVFGQLIVENVVATS